MKFSDVFDGELLFTFYEAEVIVAIDAEDGPKVWIGDTEITWEIPPTELESLGEAWADAKHEKDEDDTAAYGDYLYEQEKDKRLSEL